MKFERGNGSNKYNAGVLETDALEQDGQEVLAVDGKDVFVNAGSDNENVYGRTFGGSVFFAIGGNIGCVHS